MNEHNISSGFGKEYFKNSLYEQIVFEDYKDKNLKNITNFKKIVEKEYGFYPSDNLYRKIIKYQISKYGCALNKWISGDLDYVPHMPLMNKNYRENRKKICEKRYRDSKNLNRLEQLAEMRLKNGT